MSVSCAAVNVHRQNSEGNLLQAQKEKKGEVKAKPVDIQDVLHVSGGRSVSAEGSHKAKTSNIMATLSGTTFQQWHFHFITGSLDKCIISTEQCGCY